MIQINYKLQEKLQKEKVNLLGPNKSAVFKIINLYTPLKKIKNEYAYMKHIFNLEGFHLLAFIQIYSYYKHKL